MKVIESVKLTNHRRKCHEKINKQLFGYGLCVNNLSIVLVILCKKNSYFEFIIVFKRFFKKHQLFPCSKCSTQKGKIKLKI